MTTMPNRPKQRVIVGMSGGVDSSTAAALLLQQGYEVIGITLQLWPSDRPSLPGDRRCGPEAAQEALHVAEKLGIPHLLIDAVEPFQRQVIRYFAAEYQAGRTPNPCVVCNEQIKFGTLLDCARRFDADFVATGHYARVDHSAPGGRTLLRRGRDPRKDQSYFLFSLRQEQLARTLFPLGELTKAETRAAARGCRLRTAEREESMEICFVPGNDYGAFLTAAGLVETHRGEIVDVRGKVLGYHNGVEFYTIGQRKGLRLSAPKPLYVLDLDPAANRVVVGEASALACEEFFVERCTWVSVEAPPPCFRALTKIRYNHPGAWAMATVVPDGRIRVKCETPQRAVTPGQACVFYQEDLVLGGGWITREEHSTLGTDPAPEAGSSRS